MPKCSDVCPACHYGESFLLAHDADPPVPIEEAAARLVVIALATAVFSSIQKDAKPGEIMGRLCQGHQNGFVEIMRELTGVKARGPNR